MTHQHGQHDHEPFGDPAAPHGHGHEHGFEGPPNGRRRRGPRRAWIDHLDTMPTGWLEIIERRLLETARIVREHREARSDAA